jgi:hypothetical protein
MKIFVTGMHGAGTRSAAIHFAKKHMLKPYQEIGIELSLLNAQNLGDNIVLQCPQMAHHVFTFSNMGTVYWMTKDHVALVKTMWGMNTGRPAWDMMKNLKMILPEDPVWDIVDYDGREDVYYGYTGYYALFVKLKDYLMRKHFAPYVTILRAEEMPYWDQSKCKKHTLSQKQTDLMNWYFDYWAEIEKDL